jgi:hypothetical protein
MTDSISSYGSDGSTGYVDIHSVASELAVMLVNAESNEEQSATQARAAARADFLEQADNQVSALRSAANATETGALVGAMLTAGGGVCSIEGGFSEFDASASGADTASDKLAASIWSTLGKGLADLSQPAKAIVGDSTAERYQADAQRYETAGEQAKWEASDAQSSIDESGQQSDKVLGLVQNIEQDHNAAMNAVIGRV